MRVRFPVAGWKAGGEGRRARVVPVVAGSGMAVLALCGFSGGAPLQTYVVGPAGHQLRVAASPAQRVVTSTTTEPTAPTPQGSALLFGATAYRATLALPGHGQVRVSIEVSPTPIRAAHARWIIHDFFNNTPEQLTTWRGSLADAGVKPCDTPGGPCPGYVGGIQVVRNGALFDVWVQAGTQRLAWAVVHSFGLAAAGHRAASP